MMDDAFEVTKEFDFCYAHMLTRHSGACRNVHGHNARVQVTVFGKPDSKTGMVIDFGDLKALVGYVLDKLDHAFLCALDTPVLLEDVLNAMGSKTYHLGTSTSTAENIVYVLTAAIRDELMRFEHEGDAVFVYVDVALWETPTSRVTHFRMLTDPTEDADDR